MREGLAILLILACMSCSKPKPCTIPPEAVLIRFVDGNTNDLLSPNNPAAFSESDITLTYLDSGIIKTIPTTIYQLSPNMDRYVLNTDIGWHADRGRTFYLRLSPSDVDTIYARVDKTIGNCTWFKSGEFLYNSQTLSRGNLPPSQVNIYSIRK